MKALCWFGTGDVRVETVDDPKIQEPTDVIVRITSSGICGSDLHLFDGFMPTMEKGDVLGHEPMGIVEEVGSSVRKLKRGDRVVVPFTISCGDCFFCKKTLYSSCDVSNPNAEMARKAMGHSPAGLFGYSHLLGGFPGGQAEYLRVPYADVGPCLSGYHPSRQVGLCRHGCAGRRSASEPGGAGVTRLPARTQTHPIGAARAVATPAAGVAETDQPCYRPPMSRRTTPHIILPQPVSGGPLSPVAIARLIPPGDRATFRVDPASITLSPRTERAFSADCAAATVRHKIPELWFGQFDLTNESLVTRVVVIRYEPETFMARCDANYEIVTKSAVQGNPEPALVAYPTGTEVPFAHKIRPSTQVVFFDVFFDLMSRHGGRGMATFLSVSSSEFHTAMNQKVGIDFNVRMRSEVEVAMSWEVMFELLHSWRRAVQTMRPPTEGGDK